MRIGSFERFWQKPGSGPLGGTGEGARRSILLASVLARYIVRYAPQRKEADQEDSAA